MTGFFDEPSETAGDGSPYNEISDEPQPPVVGSTLPLDVAIGRSDAAALALRAVRARPTGVQFTITAYWRKAEQVHAGWGGTTEYPLVGAMSESPTWTRLFPGGFGRDDDLDEAGELLPGFIRFGLRFSDGSAVSNVSYMAWTLRDRSAVPSVGMAAGGGHGSAYGTGSYGWHDANYWVWPLPPLPSLDVVCSWPAFDIPETVTSLDTEPMHEAASRARPIWSDWNDLDPNRFRGPWHSFE